MTNGSGNQSVEPVAGFVAGQVMVPPGSLDKYDAASLVENQGLKRFHVKAKPAIGDRSYHVLDGEC